MSYSNVVEAGRRALERSILTYQGQPVGTVAARVDGPHALNYDQCFTRDFFVSAIAFLMRGQSEIVRSFLTVLVEMQSHEHHLDCFKPGPGLMPASFAVRRAGGEETLVPDFGERAIARVPPVDSGLWWLILLRAYTRATGDESLARRDDFQTAIRLVLELSLTTRYDMFPTMLVPDGGYMIDRRLGVYGYPLDVQALFFAALAAARELLATDDALVEAATERTGHLMYHLRHYYWMDFERLNEIHRYQVDEYGDGVVNAFNIQPSSIPDWVEPWLPSRGGYFAGNLGPGRIDLRYFALGNLLAVVSSLASDEQSAALLDLIEVRWDDLMGTMPVKLTFPALEGADWKIVTGSDPKNIPWSYHNGGNWPFLLWLFAAAATKANRRPLAQRALDLAATRLHEQRWPEYYDGRDGRLIGRQARCYQTWSIAGFVAAHDILEDPGRADMVTLEPAAPVIACATRVAKERG